MNKLASGIMCFVRRVRRVLVLAVGVGGVAALGYAAQDPYAAHIAPTDPLSPEAERAKFHLPPGFAIELVAAEPDIRKPMNMAFDDRGRLWVTESTEYPFPPEDLSKSKDCVKILEDTDGDGRVDKVTRFAEHLSIPIGVLPVSDGAIVFSIPKLYKFTDTNGDDRADQTEALFGPFGRDDTHGLVNTLRWGFDGWIYVNHGFANKSEIQGKDGHSIKMHSGNIFRIREDGSRCEYYTHGQVNPFGSCFDALGNLYTADCHSKPVYMLLRGAWYPSFGAPHDGLGYGPIMCKHSHGSTAICGITYYAADHFPPEYRDTVFIGNVVTNRVNFDHLEPHGSTLLAVEQPDFIRSDDPWFRPVDIRLGPDGALYIADFYNKVIGHYEVPLTHPARDHERGRIWRVVYRGTYVPMLAGILGDVTEAPAMRAYAAKLLGGIRQPAAIDSLVNPLRSAPERLALRIAEELARNKDGVDRLLTEITAGQASAYLLTARNVRRHLDRANIAGLKERIEKLTAGLPETEARVRKLMGQRKAGFAKAKTDLRRGAKVFEKSCAPCHRIGEVGEKIGPELAGIGVRGLDRILEDTLDPSRNVDQAFRATAVLLEGDVVRTGLLQDDSGEVLVLADAAGNLVRYPKNEVVEWRTENLSPMPSNIAEDLPEPEFYDLLAFLLAQRQPPEPTRAD